MSRKDYERAVRIIDSHRPFLTAAERLLVTNLFNRYFQASENDRYDPDRFYQALGYESSEDPVRNDA